MVRVLPFPVDLSKMIDETCGDWSSDPCSIVYMDRYMPGVFDYSYVGYYDNAVLEGRRQSAAALAAVINGIVFEYYFLVKGYMVWIHGYSIVKDEAELRDRLSVYCVMTS